MFTPAFLRRLAHPRGALLRAVRAYDTTCTGWRPDAPVRLFAARDDKLIGDNGTGVFYRRIESAVDLQRKVVESLRELAAAPSPLTFESLAAPAGIDWGPDSGPSSSGSQDALLVVHIRPLNGTRMLNRVFYGLPQRLVATVRNANLVDQSVGLVPSNDGDAVVVSWPRTNRRGFGSVYPSEPVSVRMNADGEVALSWTLPGDGLGSS